MISTDRRPVADERLERFIRLMPKVELHLHLEGSVRATTLLDLARRYGVALPADDVDGLARWYACRDLRRFGEVWEAIVTCLRRGADFARIMRELGESAAAQQVRCVQVTFAPSTHRRIKSLPYDEIWGGIREGADWVERTLGVRLQFAPAFSRGLRPAGTGGDGSVEETLEFAVAHRGEGVVALGMGGYEPGNPPELFEEVFQSAKAQGLRCWPHAGETAGPESIWGAVRTLGADRIAHGVRAVEDPDLPAYLAAHRIGCDVCPTSNVCLGVSPSLEQHPIRRLLAAGVPVTVNSDDPPLFGTTLTDEFLALACYQRFTAAELAALVRTAVEVSFLPKDEMAALRARFDRELETAACETGVDL
ncbi:MAG: adenosine deaminase [Chloroflexi bacterium]|nr:adenosine deaminase [Chloroflexota bacterium]